MYNIPLGAKRLFFDSGFTPGDVGVTILNSDSSIKVARSTTNVSQLRSDKYRSYLTFTSSSFPSGWTGYVKLDDTIITKLISIKII